jgi:hypothetical protein
MGGVFHGDCGLSFGVRRNAGKFGAWLVTNLSMTQSNERWKQLFLRFAHNFGF